MKTIEPHADQRYIDGLLHNDRRTIDEIYKNFSSRIKSYIINNSGSSDDAADIFQETLIDLYQQAKHKGLTLTCPFEPFFLLLCKRKWLNALKKKSISQVTNSNESLLLNVSDDAAENAEQVEEQQRRTDLYMQALEKISERCREIIKAALSGGAQDKLAEQLNVTYAYFRKKKSECMASLIKIIKEKN